MLLRYGRNGAECWRTWASGTPCSTRQRAHPTTTRRLAAAAARAAEAAVEEAAAEPDPPISPAQPTAAQASLATATEVAEEEAGAPATRAGAVGSTQSPCSP